MTLRYIQLANLHRSTNITLNMQYTSDYQFPMYVATRTVGLTLR